MNRTDITQKRARTDDPADADGAPPPQKTLVDALRWATRGPVAVACSIPDGGARDSERVVFPLNAAATETFPVFGANIGTIPEVPPGVAERSADRGDAGRIPEEYAGTIALPTHADCVSHGIEGLAVVPRGVGAFEFVRVIPVLLRGARVATFSLASRIAEAATSTHDSRSLIAELSKLATDSGARDYLTAIALLDYFMAHNRVIRAARLGLADAVKRSGAKAYLEGI